MPEAEGSYGEDAGWLKTHLRHDASKLTVHMRGIWSVSSNLLQICLAPSHPELTGGMMATSSPSCITAPSASPALGTST